MFLLSRKCLRVAAKFAAETFMPATRNVAAPFGYYVGGPFANVSNRFLGLKFKIDGQAHYGWAAPSVKAGVSGHKPGISVTLLGYAYEFLLGHSQWHESLMYREACADKTNTTIK